MQTTWSKKMADSMLAGKPVMVNKWAYENGVALKGFESIWRKTGDQKYFDYIKEQMDLYVQEDGTIKSYKPEEYNIDHINNGKLLFMLYKETGEEKYKKAAYQLRGQLDTHPRTKEGVFWHKKIYEHQIWLDGLYMGAPFYAEFTKEFEDGKNFDDVAKQYIVCYNNLLDKKTGLLYHAWDESRTEFWCDPETGLSKNFWGRSMGWYTVGLVDTLDFIPDDHKDRAQLIEILTNCLEALLKFQDAASGCWYQVIDKQERKGNYIEASATCMIFYSMTKAYNKGYIQGDKWVSAIDKTFNGIIDEFILVTAEGYVNLNKVCEVAGLGNKQKRDGTFEYYISEPIICNDMKGVGAFILGMLAYEEFAR